MLISTRFGNTPQLHRVAMPRGARQQLTFYDEPVTAAWYEPRQGRYVVFTRDVGGNEFAQLYRYDLADGRVTLLTDGGRSQNGNVRSEQRGDRIAYGSYSAQRRRSRHLRDGPPRPDERPDAAAGDGWRLVRRSTGRPTTASLLVIELVSVNQ